MAYEPKPGDGSLFKNEYKHADNHPDATGYILAHRDIKAGERLELGAWTKEGTKGKFQSLRMSDPYEGSQPMQPDNGVHITEVSNELDDEIPF
tara:strand:+ start:43 stop:321 length:279 start_codon:yes stop_codon:yes gene_type:complete